VCDKVLLIHTNSSLLSLRLWRASYPDGILPQNSLLATNKTHSLCCGLHYCAIYISLTCSSYWGFKLQPYSVCYAAYLLRVNAEGMPFGNKATSKLYSNCLLLPGFQVIVHIDQCFPATHSVIVGGKPGVWKYLEHPTGETGRPTIPPPPRERSRKSKSHIEVFFSCNPSPYQTGHIHINGGTVK
jgi:hypothetical protein